YGIQLKSHYDINEEAFAPKTLTQIQDSRQHGLKRLYVLLAGDMTNRSQEEKVRSFEARVSKQNDHYTVSVCPERLWSLLFGNNGEGSRCIPGQLPRRVGQRAAGRTDSGRARAGGAVQARASGAATGRLGGAGAWQGCQGMLTKFHRRFSCNAI